MSFAAWALIIGGILLIVGFTHSLFKDQPITSAIIYLVFGIALGPTGFSLFHFNPLKESFLLEILTEMAVLISLFSAGVKMPVPFKFIKWRSPIRLAFLSMSTTVAMVAVFGVYFLNLPLGAAVLLGAIAAPTDPVLATDVQIRHPGERDKLRFTLTSEAGMNDGSAFPFVMLGLGLLTLETSGHGDFSLIEWVLRDVVWATLGAIAIGIAAGYSVAYILMRLRRQSQSIKFLEDFIGLGLIGATYGASVLTSTWGFLAVFVAAVALRQTEIHFARLQHAIAEEPQSGEKLHTEKTKQLKSDDYFVSESSLVFKEHLERLSELALIILIGGTLFPDSWSWRAVAFAGFLFFMARPVSVFVGLIGTKTSLVEKGLIGWFGVRGIGSLYYLMYAIQHGLPEDLALELIHITLIMVTLSILVHGISARHIIKRFWRVHAKH
ncbi:K(+)/H(+) antiporter NhaP [Thalassocella blandensis]|nr:K(+)/H(+) antiporter NhaP [Thalassocella blandensis]